jgi:hypothetical protein
MAIDGQNWFTGGQWFESTSAHYITHSEEST